ncbi:hypothetical protein CEN45_16995 [Fischerella thermalis CCMEE 5198]|jgi:hypothetical protein|uniref:hypothetical protein n=1 Tax=Fischerella thermalis TaxID=372787 RepID=UPI000C7F8222|nr:hypothetical protein [Fischerella thermalis]PMB04864.1 hypothetical protein CI594_04005 [Fischerella thermalis CCMEE 5196]PMB20362.1 hypothetical protein CEN45_16995 [Fischerella thermalis CCMEE 5198]PMB53401.1 hypothetical protein CEN39_04695 [Fischerella thermalis CCMEE 5201]
MELDFSRQDFALQAGRQDLNWSSDEFGIKIKQQHFQPNTWVRLLELVNPYSFDEALLLCPISQDKWIAWIPDHGEAVLSTRQFRII